MQPKREMAPPLAGGPYDVKFGLCLSFCLFFVGVLVIRALLFRVHTRAPDVWKLQGPCMNSGVGRQGWDNGTSGQYYSEHGVWDPERRH